MQSHKMPMSGVGGRRHWGVPFADVVLSQLTQKQS
jgi:hypothetical protein